jgi:hypothetical protein
MRFFLSFVISFSFYYLTAQTENISINNNGNPPDPSAILDIQSNNKGVAFPRMTTDERDAITSPTLGLMIYNIDKDCIEYYAGLLWIEVCGSVAMDNTYPSGIYVSPDGNNNNGNGTPWSPYRTLKKGLAELAIQDKDTLRIAVGNYFESDIIVDQKTGYVILGKYDGFSWKRSSSGNTIVFMDTSSHFTIAYSENISLKHIWITGNTSRYEDPTSYGLKIIESTGIELDSCRIKSKEGYDQPMAESGIPGYSGDSGYDGDNGSSMSIPRGGVGGNGVSIGGKGGDGVIGSTGMDGQSGNPGEAGGAGGIVLGGDGQNGADGINGNPGLDGSGGGSFGTAGISYDATNNGTIGHNGTDGTAGGGGGGGCGDGQSGNPGEAGGAGGIVLGGDAISGTGAGGRGGLGGNGGKGGSGGGGGGGPSFSIYNVGTSITNTSNTTLNFGNAGEGGFSFGGGPSSGQNGISGEKNF